MKQSSLLNLRTQKEIPIFAMSPDLFLDALYEGGFARIFLAEHSVTKTVQWKNLTKFRYARLNTDICSGNINGYMNINMNY